MKSTKLEIELTDSGVTYIRAEGREFRVAKAADGVGYQLTGQQDGDENTLLGQLIEEGLFGPLTGLQRVMDDWPDALPGKPWEPLMGLEEDVWKAVIQ